MILATAALCLAANIFHEARGEMVPGQYAVALVTLNRAKGDQSQVCKEVFKRRQFSWTSSVEKTRKGWVLPRQLVPKDAAAWTRAKRIAEVTLQGRMPDLTKGATFYHADYVRPYWRLHMQPTKILGRHCFYRSNGQS